MRDDSRDNSRGDSAAGVEASSAANFEASSETGTEADSQSWAQWDRFVAGHPDGGFLQSAAWARCRTWSGFASLAVILRDDADDSIVGGAVLYRRSFDSGRGCFYYIQEGPLLPEHPEEARAVFEAILARIGRDQQAGAPPASHLRVEFRRADWPSAIPRGPGFEPSRIGDPYHDPRHTICVDLEPDATARLAAMRPKGRYNIAVARRHGVTATRDDSDAAMDEFVEIQTINDERHGLRPRDGDYYRSIMTAFGDRAGLHFAEFEGRRLATALVIRFGDRATYYFGGSRPEHRNVMAPYLLHHDVMETDRAEGCRCYDFWGAAPPGEPDHRWAGLSAFKRKFGGREVSLVAGHDLIFDADLYRHFANPGAD